MRVISGPTRPRRRRITSVARSRSGGPESPPAPAASTCTAGEASPSREIVVLVATIPSSPSATARSATSSTSSSVRSGAILTSSGHVRGGDLVGAAADCLEQRLQPLHGLQVAQPRCVRRGDVDDQVVGVRREQGGALLVVAHGVVLGDHLGLADVDAEGYAEAKAGAVEATLGQPARDDLGAVVVEAHPVDDRAVGRQPREPGLGVAGLRLPRDGADLDEPEPHVGQGVDADGVLVEARRETHQAGEVQAHHPPRADLLDLRPAPVEHAGHRLRGPDRTEGGTVRPLGVGAGQHPVEELPVGPHSVALLVPPGPVLQRAHPDLARAHRLDPLHGSAETLHGGDARDVAEDGRRTDLVAVEPG